jgi:hypothetical protein
MNRKPAKPKKPSLPKKPPKEISKQIQIAYYSDNTNMSLKDLLEIISGKGVPLEDVTIDISLNGLDGYDDYGGHYCFSGSITIYSNSFVPNPRYNNGMKLYKKKLITYNEKLAKYNEKLAKYKIKLSEWEEERGLWKWMCHTCQTRNHYKDNNQNYWTKIKNG